MHWLRFLWYELAYWISFPATLLGCSMRIDGRRHMPRHGPVLVIANHQSFLDPVLVGVVSPRHLCFLARKTLFRHRLFAWLIRSLDAVPIDQDGIAKEGIRTILAQLQAGRAVSVFPEGERTWDGELLPLKPGIQLLIKRVQAPIVPVGIAGAFDVLPRTRRLPALAPLFLPATRATLAVSIGKPLDARRFAAMTRERMLEELFVEMRKVCDHAERLRRKP